jgi:hypothetical protein
MKYIAVSLLLLTLVGCFPSNACAQSSTITLVQHTSKDAGTSTSSTLAFKSNNTAGNWIGVIVRAGRSSEIFTITDSRGNIYHKAGQFNVTLDVPNGHTLGVFYAENIAGGANTITLSDSISGTLRFAIVEYSGIAAANSLDVFAGSQGNGVAPNSGNATTTSVDLVLGAISTANPASYTAGSGFAAVESVPIEPSAKLFVEQQIQTIPGTESTHATLATSDAWGAVLAGFKGTGAAVTAPNITSLTPASGAVGTPVTIVGTNFGTVVGTVSFHGTAATPTSWSTTRVVVPVPTGATTGNVVLTDPGVASNGVTFTVTTPDTTPPVVAISAPLNNATISGTTTVTASATDNVAVAKVQFKLDGGNVGAAILSTPYSYALNTSALSNGNHSLTAVATDTSGNATTSAVVTVNVSNSALAPSISSLSPTSGLVGVAVTISGTNFGATQGTSAVTFNGIVATTTGWNSTSIGVNVPSSATTGNVVVKVGGAASNGVAFTVTVPQPSITSLSPTSGLVGVAVTISGANFGATQGTSTVTFNGIAAASTGWNSTSVGVNVPSGATTGNVVVKVGGAASNGVAFTVTVPQPSITSLNPTSGFVGASVTITGVNLGTTQGTSTVRFNGASATPTSWSATSLAVLVPAAATTGNVVVTVGGTASNGLAFTVLADTSAPVVTISAPTSNATVSGTITLTATATDADSPVSFVQFLVDGLNTGARLTIAPYSILFDTTTLLNGNHVLTGVAQDPAGNQGTSAALTFTIANGTASTIGPLKQSTINSRYLVSPAGNAVFLSGSHTWNDFQDTNTNSSPVAQDFNSYVNFLKTNGQNVTVLWHKDLPEYCGWNVSGSTWTMTPWPWLRPGPGVATDSKPKFDLTQFNQAYFDQLRARVQQLQQNGIYAIVQLFDGNQLTSARCSTDGYAFSGPNNINGVSDGYSSGAAGVSSVTMTANNAITNFQDAYAKKAVDTLNDLPTVIWEIAEEQPGASMTWWAPHMMGLVRTYEGGGVFEGTTYTAKAFQHPVGIGSLNFFDQNDTTLYGSIATWVAPTLAASVFPSNVPVNNKGKVAINDSDHSLGYKAFTNADGSIQDQNLRGYLWENLTNGAEGVIFMDPYEIFWQGSPVRNTCLNPSSQVCTGGVDTKYNKFRASMGHLQSFVNNNLNLLKMTPQGGLSSTGFCLADNSATGAEYVVYAPSGGTFTVNLSATSRTLNVAWFNPLTGATTAGAAIAGGSTKSFTAPFGGDAVLYLVDAAGHN